MFLVNLIFKYNSEDKKSLALNIDLHYQKYNLNISDNRTMKKTLKSLYDNGYLQNNITSIKKTRYTPITLAEKAINIENGFVQLDYNIIHRNVVWHITWHGVRLMYYYESYINRKKRKLYCYTSLQTISDQTGLSRPLIVKTNEILIKHELISKQVFEVESNLHYKHNKEIYNFERFTNHYTLNEKQLEKVAKKKID